MDIPRELDLYTGLPEQTSLLSLEVFSLLGIRPLRASCCACCIRLFVLPVQVPPLLSNVVPPGLARSSEHRCLEFDALLLLIGSAVGCEIRVAIERRGGSRSHVARPAERNSKPRIGRLAVLVTSNRDGNLKPLLMSSQMYMPNPKTSALGSSYQSQQRLVNTGFHSSSSSFSMSIRFLQVITQHGICISPCCSDHTAQIPTVRLKLQQHQRL